jgi:hypothetical protein
MFEYAKMASCLDGEKEQPSLPHRQAWIEVAVKGTLRFSAPSMLWYPRNSGEVGQGK